MGTHYLSSDTFKTWFYGIFLLCLTGWWMSSCTPQDEEVTPDASAMLRFEADTVMFDTVFTEVGSVTKRLKVYNPNEKAVRIAEIKVAGETSSAFQIYVNGIGGPQLQEVELRGKDSLLVLVKATINPTTANQPFLITDSISFLTNGNKQQVQLVAYGQNAYFYRNNRSIACQEVWGTDKAHVIYDSVTVSEGCTLTIQKGTQVFFQNKAKLKVLGTLLVQGEHEQRVSFKQIRQEEQYRNAAGQWQGIEFGANSQGTIRYAELKNATTAILAQVSSTNKSKVTLENTFIRNMLENGVYSHGGDVRVVNSIISNCGMYAFAGMGSGRYEILYSTLANYSQSFIRRTPSFFFQGNYQLEIVNSILWGREADELTLNSTAGATVNVRSSFLKTQANQTALAGNNNQINVDPKFRDAPNYDFQIIKLSPANKAGIPISGIAVDFENKERDLTTPDVGALEVHD